VLSCQAGGHHQGVTVKVSGEMSRHVGIVSLVHWVGNANQPDALPIRAVSAGGKREASIQHTFNFMAAGPRLWNSLPIEIQWKDITFECYRQLPKAYLFV